MKKLLLSAIALMSVGVVSAQNPWSPPASVPSGTYTDLNGNSHDIQGYLNAGKTVLVDISATWCGPCWSLHNNKGLETAYQILGPNGQDDVVVLFIEGDNSTTLADLQGTGPKTIGNWIEGTNYPIIDDGALAQAFNATYFPTLFKICPDGTMTEVSPRTPIGIFNALKGCTGVELPANEIGITANYSYACDDEIGVSVKATNFGSATSTGAVDIKHQGTTVHTFNISAPSLADSTFLSSFTSSSVNTNDLTFEFTPASGTDKAYNNVDDASINQTTMDAFNEFNITLHTDSFPSETSVLLINPITSTVLWSTPQYQGNISGGNLYPGGPDADKDFSYTQNITNGECVLVYLRDSYGDGMKVAGASGAYMRVKDANNNLIAEVKNTDGNFRTVGKFVKADENVSIDEIMKGAFKIYQDGSFVIITNPGLIGNTVTITDIQGKTIHAAKVAEDLTFDTQNLASGTYLVTIGNHTEKFIVR
ncbi:MAG: T9SS type A sorting domain-containing protein [Flavobacteriales bacterium]|jgi:thiol-disulfide isomerase/thioredoxin|nr:T9SS type A sorting domain-containing protein [Flavobacteriales bacterium]